MSAQAWSCRWADLADPRDERAPDGTRCSAMLYEEVCRHIVQKHVACPSEPWDEMLPKDLLRKLVGLWASKVDRAQRTAVLQTFSEHLYDAARECLERPLVLLCVRAAGGGARVQIWLLVLRCGALLVAEARDSRVVVKTCFFPRTVCRVPKSGQRWLQLLRTLVLRYATVGPKAIVPPSGPVVNRFSGKRWDEVHFVKLETWGFCTQVEGTPWRGRASAWPTGVNERPRRRLLPRRLVEDEAYGHA